MGDQWLKLDVYFLVKPFTLRLRDEFGLVGVLTWVAFLCACKRNSVQGRVTFGSDAEARHRLFLDHAATLDLVDDDGKPWSLDDFWTFTGRMKQTRRTARGRVRNVICTHWERWQNDQNRDSARERKRRSRARSVTPMSRPENESEKEKEIESDGVTSASPQRADAPPSQSENGTSRRHHQHPDTAAVADLKAALRGYHR